ncbi:hypothetical protein GARC_3846 [Paraglaciecola arctica BSs20135]|uniref:Solute-binding protein family 3/N-terminal domain-containing protein n=2 Tax=Paraglaciecola TaxID=1621534 RepID=K6ZBM2_9ALTE|nr:hypothetical protein GARC_3846 [Paraglaciecola arctica BSs20135]
MKIDLTACLLCCVVSVNLFLHHHVKAQDKPTYMTFSYVDHPVIVNELVPIIRRAYLDLGIQIELVMLPAHRNLKAVESEEVDGDIAYSDVTLDGYDTLIKIEPSMVTAVIVLLCLPDIQCNKEILFDDTKGIVSTDTIYKSVQAFYSKPLSRSFYTINNLSIISELLVLKRFQYGIYVLGESQVISPDIEHLKVIELFKTQTHHTVNQKYAFMKDEISAALQRSMDKAKK